MTILVTGATGLLGNNIVRLLLDQGRQVRVLTRSQAPPRALQGLSVEVVTGDVTQRAEVEKACEGVEAIIHSAGHVHIGWSQQDVHHAINVEGTRYVAETALARQTPLVYVSSVNALGISGPGRVVDEDTVQPGITNCPYVQTKREAEQLVLSLVQRGLHGVVVNPGFMLGPWDWKPSSGRMLVEVATKFLPLAPAGSFSVCDVRDVAAGTIAALERGRPGRHYILCGHNLRYFDLWRKMAQVAGVRGPLFPAGPLQRYGGGLFGDLYYKLTGHEPDLNTAGVHMSSLHHNFSSERAVRELGYRIRPLEETIQDAYRWFVEHDYIKR